MEERRRSRELRKAPGKESSSNGTQLIKSTRAVQESDERRERHASCQLKRSVEVRRHGR
jgi:hypothetical protein